MKIDQKLIIAIVYILGSLFLAVYSPDTLSLWFGIVQPIVTFYFVKQEIQSKIFDKPKGIEEDVLRTLLWVLVLFLIVTVFTYAFVHVFH